MNRFALAGVAIAAVAVIALGGLMLLPRDGTEVGVPPVATTPPPTPVPTPTPAPTPVAYSSLPGWIVFEHFGKAPDGSTTTMDFDRRQVWMVKADGTGLRELAPGLPVDGKSAPDISPDGSKVAFASWAPKSQVWEVGIDGGDPRLVSIDCSGVQSECVEVDPAYSPDGQRIAFVRSTDGLKTSEVAIRDLATGEVTRLPSTSVPGTDGWIAQPTWSPDGLQIAYHRNTQKAYETSPSDTRIWIVNADGTDLYQLATPAEEKAADPDWSPDGSRIVFATEGARESEGRDVSPRVYTIGADGADPQLVSDTADGGGLAPTWTPDGEHILAWGTRTWNLMDPDGGNNAPINAPGLTFYGDELGYGYVAVWQPTP
jgi:Tol biopolymer transport system component